MPHQYATATQRTDASKLTTSKLVVVMVVLALVEVVVAAVVEEQVEAVPYNVLPADCLTL
jgi:hypothetical protein